MVYCNQGGISTLSASLSPAGDLSRCSVGLRSHVGSLEKTKRRKAVLSATTVTCCDSSLTISNSQPNSGRVLPSLAGAGDAALLVNPESVSEIANAMQKLIENPDLRLNLIEKGKIQRAKFSWDKTAEIVYRQAVEMVKAPHNS